MDEIVNLQTLTNRTIDRLLNWNYVNSDFCCLKWVDSWCFTNFNSYQT